MTIYRHQPIKRWHLQGKLALYPRTIRLSIEHLIKNNIITTNMEGSLILTGAIQKECDRGIQVFIPPRPTKRNAIEQRRKRAIVADDAYLKLMVVSVSAVGNYSFCPTSNPGPGSGSLPSISITYDKGLAKPKTDWFTPHNKSGVGLSDFKKGQGPARLDKQILMGYSEVFAYKDFNESKVKDCIEELTDRRTGNPVLKEITVFDHKFLSYVYDSEKPHLDTLQAEGSDYVAGSGDNNKFKKRIIVNDENGSKLRFYHDIIYDKNNHSDSGGQDTVRSRLVFDINNEETIRNLGLDIFYKSKKNSFSTFLWNEPRYMIVDPLLLEFVNNCWQVFFFVSERMRYTYVHDLWPKQNVGRNKYKLIRINNSTIRTMYIKWYKKLFGSQRFYGRDFVSNIMNAKRHLDNINGFKKYLKRLERKTVLQYCKIEDIKESFKTITKSQQNAQGIINFYDAAIKREYQNIMDPIYSQVREKYNDITESLLHILFPEFLEKFNIIPK